MSAYIAARLDGSVTRHFSRAGLDAARRRGKGGRTVVDSWAESDPPPATSDARQWDRYRERHGYAGGGS